MISKKKIDIIFVGLVRNCEKTIPIFFNFLKKIKRNYSIYVIVGENSSYDKSKDLLLDFQKKNLSIFKLVDLKKN